MQIEQIMQQDIPVLFFFNNRTGGLDGKHVKGKGSIEAAPPSWTAFPILKF